MWTPFTPIAHPSKQVANRMNERVHGRDLEVVRQLSLMSANRICACGAENRGQIHPSGVRRRSPARARSAPADEGGYNPGLACRYLPRTQGPTQGGIAHEPAKADHDLVRDGAV